MKKSKLLTLDNGLILFFIATCCLGLATAINALINTYPAIKDTVFLLTTFLAFFGVITGHFIQSSNMNKQLNHKLNEIEVEHKYKINSKKDDDLREAKKDLFLQAYSLNKLVADLLTNSYSHQICLLNYINKQIDNLSLKDEALQQGYQELITLKNEEDKLNQIYANSINELSKTMNIVSYHYAITRIVDIQSYQDSQKTINRILKIQTLLINKINDLLLEKYDSSSNSSDITDPVRQRIQNFNKKTLTTLHNQFKEHNSILVNKLMNNTSNTKQVPKKSP